MIYPGKPKEITIGTLFRMLSENPDWVCEPKWNGWRCELVSNCTELRAFNHNGDKLSYFSTNGIIMPDNTQLDCEWVDRRTTNTKNLLVVFGILKYEGKVLEGIKEQEIRDINESLFQKNKIRSEGELNIVLVKRFKNEFERHFSRLKNNDEIEGLVLKNQKAGLEISYKGKFKSCNQIKVKK